MTVIQINEIYLKSMKRKLRAQCDAGSVHLTEAIARGCGYKTNAALQADLKGEAEGRYVSFDAAAFLKRLRELGGTAPDEIELPELGHSARYIENLFVDPALDIVEMYPTRTRFRLSGIETVVQVDLEGMSNGYTRFHRSHAIHTPSQIGPYWPSRDFDDDPVYAMQRAITSIADYYRQAVREGHKPEPSWLVKSR